MSNQVSQLFESRAPTFDTAAASEIVRSHYGIEASAKMLVSERDQNFRIDSTSGVAYVLKIANAAEAAEVIDYENAIVRHIDSVSPELPVPRLLNASDGSSAVTIPGENGTSHFVRVLSWLDGTLLRNVEVGPPLRRQLGTGLAELGLALRGFFHPAAKKDLLWDITQLAKLNDKVGHIEDLALRSLCADFISRFSAAILPKLARLRAQVIYNDLNPSNVLVSADAAQRVTGIVDFGDTIHGPLICDVAVAAAYQLIDGDDPIEGVLDFVAAYHNTVPLEAAELDVLLDLIIARAVTTVVVSSWRAKLHPHNRDYILRNADSAARNVRNLVSLDREQTTDRFRRICPAFKALTSTLR